MTRLRYSIVAAILVYSVHHPAGACDDFDEEMAVAAAYEASKLAQSQVSREQAGQPMIAPPSATETGVASLQPPLAPVAADTVQR
jgi:hypothetical protein